MSETATPISTPYLQLDRLRPTQMSVGLIEVHQKRAEIAGIRNDLAKLCAFQAKNAIPGVYGPGKRFYIIDHHHMARALFDEGVTHAPCNVLQDLSDLDDATFWSRMASLHWVYPYDNTGRGPHPYSALPTHVDQLENDVYRSLAGAVEKSGGFTKTAVPFEEFVWADFLRGVIPLASVNDDFGAAVTRALSCVIALRAPS